MNAQTTADRPYKMQIGATETNGCPMIHGIEISDAAAKLLSQMNRRRRQRFCALRKSGVAEKDAIVQALQILRRR